MGLKPQAKKGLYIILGLAVAIGVGYKAIHSSKKVDGSQAVGQVSIASAAELSTGATTNSKLEIPTSSSPAGNGTAVKWQVMAWNAQFPLMYANGGIRSVAGSLMAKNGLDVTIIHQDDCSKTIADYIKNTNDLKSDANGVPLIMSFMGDGVPGFSVMLKELKKLGPDYAPIAFYAMGRSNGEDGFWGPQSWKDNPKNAIGHCVAGVERDGDLNIVFKWAGDNGININANSKYFDPTALNIIACADYIEAGNKYITGFTEQRKVIRGKQTIDSTATIKCDAYTSWTPVDVTVAEKKGGLVRIASTKEYTSQMPNVSIICKSWAYAHPSAMQGIIKALSAAGDQVLSFPEAQTYAGNVSAKVYGDKDGAYWKTYYNGITKKDFAGNVVPLGGSRAFNLADAANTFGLGADHIDRYKIAYETFGGILAKLYPKEMEGWSSYKDIVDKSFLTAVMANSTDDTTKSEDATAQYSSEITDRVASKAYNIQFAVGSSVINKASYAVLDEIYKSAQVSSGLSIGVYGHTDASGNANSNQTLSEARAQSVANYLKSKGLRKDRLSVQGYGSSKPIQGTTADDISNRCVEIVQGN